MNTESFIISNIIKDYNNSECKRVFVDCFEIKALDGELRFIDFIKYPNSSDIFWQKIKDGKRFAKAYKVNKEKLPKWLNSAMIEVMSNNINIRRAD